jgi:hypothetical protein
MPRVVVIHYRSIICASVDPGRRSACCAGATPAELPAGSAIVADLMANDGLQILGAECSLETGVVVFLDTGG